MEARERVNQKPILDAMKQIIAAARYRDFPQKNIKYKPRFESLTIYEKAKKAETE